MRRDIDSGETISRPGTLAVLSIFTLITSAGMLLVLAGPLVSLPWRAVGALLMPLGGTLLHRAASRAAATTNS